nr:MAG TPA: hypothetical protein [Caudoviricetes sp.]
MNKFLEIFKSGKHVAADGSEINFSDADVENIAKNYNPKVHEAPIVVGHPKSNAPAFGWIKGLLYDAANKALKAIPAQLNPDFVEAVRAGSYKKISASLYSPDSPNNPTPGQYSLRHVGFLGAQPPAIKGLAAVEFAENEQTVELELDFADLDAAWNDKYISRVLRSLKNFLIDKFTQEEADAAIPEWELEGLNTTAERAIAQETQKNDFSEPTAEPANRELEAAKEKSAALEAELSRMKAEKAQTANAEFCDARIKEGRLLPAQKAKVLVFMNSLENTELEFSEDDKRGNLDFFKEFITSMPVQVNFSEVAATPDKDTPDASDPKVLAEKALAYQEERAKAGKIISISEAVRFVKG